MSMQTSDQVFFIALSSSLLRTVPFPFVHRSEVRVQRARAQGPLAMRRLGRPLLPAPLRDSGSVPPRA